MELTLKRLLEQAEFTDARKGYDRSEVDEFLDRAVAMATKVEAKLTETLGQVKVAGSSQGPTTAQLETEVQRRVTARIAELPAASAAPAGPSEEESAEEVRRMIVLAQRTADAAVRESRQGAAKLLSDAQERAATIDAKVEAEAASSRAEVTAEAESERRAARERLAAEIGELEGIREALRTDVTMLERHVDEQRNQLRSTVGELQRLLDDPAGFRLAPAPALLDPAVPDLSTPSGPTAGAEEPPVAETVIAVPPAEEPPEGPAPVVTQTAVVIDDETPAGPSTPTGGPNFEAVDHAAPGVHDPLESGPPTAPVSSVDLGIAPEGGAAAGTAAHGEDAFLSELRKAMADDEPLGPRDHLQQPSGEFFDDDDRRGWRFGKRR